MPTQYFFPTPIYFNIIENLDIHKEVDQFLSSTVISDWYNPWGDTVKTTFKYGDYKQILDYTPTLKQIILTNCENFLLDLNLQVSIDIKESWVNISNSMDFQHYHTHDTYDISGVFFHKSSGIEGDIVFKHPSLVNRFHVITNKIDNQVKYSPEKGKLILFPSFIEHAVFHNSTDMERISISFNCKIKNE